MKKIDCSVIALTFSALLLGSACNRSADPSTEGASADGHGHDHAGGEPHAHASGAPHGGTPVQVGEHAFHLELVRDPGEGTMLAYVLDAHMEKAVNVPPVPFEMVAKTGQEEHRLSFEPGTNAPNASSTATSVFAASGEWLKETGEFEGVIPKITLGGREFENIRFTYPKGTRHIH